MAAINDSKSLFQRSAELLNEAKSILSNPASTAEDKGKIEGLMAEAQQMKADATRLNEIEKTLDEHKAQFASNGLNNAADASNANTFSNTNPDFEPYDIPSPIPGSKFRTFQGFLRAVNASGKAGKSASRNLMYFKDDAPASHETKDMAENTGASGGFLVPSEFQAQLLSLMGEQSIVRPRASIIRMRRRQVNIPVLDQTGTTANVPHWFGGIQVYWAEEAALKTQSDPSFRQISLVAHKLVGYTRASDELLDDAAISLTDFLMGPMGFAGAVAFTEDMAFLNGDGAGKPLGIINAPCTITVARENQAAVTYNDLVNMLEKFLPSGRGVWLMSQTVLSNLLTMTGPSSNPSYVWGPGPVGQTAIGNVPATLLGRPVIFTEKLPAISTTSVGDVVLADLNYYLLGDRQATTLASTIYDRFQYDQTSFRVVHRVDGQPWLSSPFTYQDGSTQISPFVILGAKST